MRTICLLVLIAVRLCCSVERCCLTTPCSQAYCTQRNSQTWISTENFANYQYTKLVLSRGSCLPCPYYCQSCSAQTTCQTCAKAFYMSNGSCALCPYRCLTCSLLNQLLRCTLCQTGAYLDSPTARCHDCATGVQQCSSQTIISQCMSGYVAVSNSLYCTACPPNCLSCPVSSAQCSQCATAYYLSSSSCSPCKIANCLTCVFSSSPLCTQCASSYMLNKGACVACGPNCLSCSTTACLVCNSASSLFSGGCVLVGQPIPQCTRYSSGTTCTACQPSYYLSNNTCITCSILCLTCTGSHFGACQSCIPTATLFNQMCIVVNFLTLTSYQLYYSFANTGIGTPDCNPLLLSAPTLSLPLNNIQAYRILISFKLYTKPTKNTFTLSLTNTSPTTLSFDPNSTPQFTCNGDNYYLGKGTADFSSVQLTNTLVFSAPQSIAVQQVVVVVYKCNSLCIECSSTLCSVCSSPVLYTQLANCVYTCSVGFLTFTNGTVKACLVSCPLGSYQHGGICNLCVSPCLTCTSSLECLTCLTGFFFTPDGKCLTTCPYRHYGDSNSRTCQQCVGRCLECTSALICLSCLNAFLQNSNCVDLCITPSSFPSLLSLTCSPCDPSCLTCEYSSTHCTTCNTASFLLAHRCLPACPVGYYASGVLCLPCSYPCLACTLMPTSCSTCLTNYLSNSTCVANCPDGYYEQGTQCSPCPAGCATCYSASLCLTCKPTHLFFESTCLSGCPAGLFAKRGGCVPCSSPCFTCVDEAKCLSCREQFLLGSGCVNASACGAGLFAEISSLACKPCLATCLTCRHTAAACTSCSGLLLLQNRACVGACSTTAVFGLNGVCSPCIAPCKTCLNASACLSCTLGYFLSGNVCSGTCTVGYFLSAGACAQCLTNCASCTASNTCSQCAVNFFLRQPSNGVMECVSGCPSLFFGDALSKTCQSCLYPCSTCSSLVDCLTCQTGTLYQARCLSNCPDSTYLSSSQCLLCVAPCSTCLSSSVCLTCLPSFLFVAGGCLTACPKGTYVEVSAQECIFCPSTCSACTNATWCTACLPDATFLFAGSCLFACPGTHYASANGSCAPCPAMCALCSSATACITCAQSYLAYRSATLQCTTSCPPTAYKDQSSCYTCVFPCATCTSLTTCTTCYFGMYSLPSLGSCVAACPAGTYAQASICVTCSAPCITCLSPTLCLSCTSTTFLLTGSCLGACPAGYFNAAGSCVQCSGLCATCSSQFYCTSCVVGYLSNGYCYLSCPPGQYEHSNACSPCVPPCLQCILTASYCTLCTGTLFTFQGTCSSSCPRGTYANGNVCLACEFPCVACSSLSVCVECLGGYLLYNGVQCIPTTPYCPNGFYKLDNQACVSRSQCPSTHYIDAVALTCNSQCTLNQYIHVTNHSCLASCPPSYYAIGGLVCSITPPASLLTMTTISFIRSSIVHVVLLFSETVLWQFTSPDIYTITHQPIVESRLLSATQNIAYTLDGSDPTDIVLAVAPLPTTAVLTMPPSTVISASTQAPSQNTQTTVLLPPYTVYSPTDIYYGTLMSAFAVGVAWFILLLSLLFLFRNKLSELYLLWDAVQLLFMLLLLDIQYPPNLNQLFNGLQYVVFTFLPNPFPLSPTRQSSPPPFHAYMYDCAYTRTAAPLLLLVAVIFALFLLIKAGEQVLKRNKELNAGKVRKIVYTLVLRFRWHHISDTIFLTYLPCVTYAVAQLSNPGTIIAMGLAVITLIIYTAFPVFVGMKLYRHLPNIRNNKLVKNLRCFYRGIDKESGFGVFLIIIRYFRRLIYGAAIALFSSRPMYALPFLMVSSMLVGLFILLKVPYEKQLSNAIEMIAEATLTLLFLLIAFMHVSDSAGVKVTLGWACCGLCTLLLLLLLFEVLCRAMFHLQEQSRDKAHPPLHLTQSHLRKKAGQFFDRIFPQLRRDWNLDDTDQHSYTPGDSDNSQNYDQRAWGIQSSHQSEEFKHYQSGSEQTEEKGNSEYLIRCVKNIVGDHQA